MLEGEFCLCTQIYQYKLNQGVPGLSIEVTQYVWIQYKQYWGYVFLQGTEYPVYIHIQGTQCAWIQYKQTGICTSMFTRDWVSCVNTYTGYTVCASHSSNPVEEIGSGYSTYVYDDNRLSLPVLREKMVQSYVMIFIDLPDGCCYRHQTNKKPGIHFQYQNRK